MPSKKKPKGRTRKKPFTRVRTSKAHRRKGGKIKSHREKGVSRSELDGIREGREGQTLRLKKQKRKRGKNHET